MKTSVYGDLMIITFMRLNSPEINAIAFCIRNKYFGVLVPGQ